MCVRQKKSVLLSFLALSLLLASSHTVLADANPSASPQASPIPKAGGTHWSVDPCALLSANDVAGTLGAVNPVPQRPTADECLWNAAANSHTPHGVSQVLFTVDAVQAARHGCHGLQCIAVVQSVTGYIPGLDGFNSTVSELGSTATLISGLGQRAAWGHGILAVLENETIFKVQLSGGQSNLLNISELLAQKVLSNMKNGNGT
jgi:hypothetical protein